MSTLKPSAVAASLIALFLVAAVPARAEHDYRHHADVWIKYDDLPKRARETVDRERGRHEIKQILEMRRDGHLYFRVLIDERGADRAIFVSEGGRLLKAAEVPDVEVGQGSFERWVKYADLPANVRRTLDHERDRREVKQIMFVRRDNREFYRCIIDTRGDDLAVRINGNGKLLSFDEVDDIAVGAHEIRRYDYSRERWIKYAEMPRSPRATLDRERHGRDVKQIVEIDRNGRHFYRCIIDERRGDRVCNISEDGYLYGEREVPEVTVGSIR
ncbi:MAG TPA: hypothetical protein VH475_23380 [Tepidisphaeraceae bacterium]|jgi:hypothetical protein